MMIPSHKKSAALSPLISRRAAQMLAVGALFAAGLHPAQAQVAYTDTGATSLFSTSITPTITADTSAANGDTLTFNDGPGYPQSDDIATALNFNALTFANIGAVVLNTGTGSNLITLASTTGSTLPTVALNNTGTVTDALALALANTTTFSGTGSATFSGVVSGAGGLTQTGTGTISLSAVNTYTGPTTITHGIVNLTGTGNLATASAVTIAPTTAALNLSPSAATTTYLFPINMSGGAANSVTGVTHTSGNNQTLQFSGAITLSGGGNFYEYGIGNSFNFNSAITGTGPLFLNAAGAGSNTFLFNAAATYTGATIFSTNGTTGIITLGAGLNALPVTTVLTLNGGSAAGPARLNMANHTQTLAGLAGNSNGQVSGGSAANPLTINGTTNNDFQGVISGPEGLTLASTNTGTQTLAGTNTYTGATMVNGGGLQLGDGGVNGNLSASTSVTLAAGTSLRIGQVNGSTATYAAFPITYLGNGNLTFVGPGNTTTSNIPGAITIGSTGTPTLTIGESNAADTVNLQGVISGTGNLVIAPSGNGNPFTVTISQPETYSGNTAITQASTGDNPTLRLLGNGTVNGGSLPSTTILTITAGSTAGRTANFDLDGQAQTLAGLVSAGTAASDRVINSVSGNAAAALTINNTAASTFAGSIGSATANTSNISLTKNGTGTFTLTGTNYYTGPTTVNNGILSDFNTGGLSVPAASAVTVNTGGTFQIANHAGGVPNIANTFTLSGFGSGGNGALDFYNSNNFSITGPVTLAADTGIRFDPQGQNSLTAPINFSNVISGPGSLTLFSTGNTPVAYVPVTLSAANTYSGANTVLTSSNADTIAPFTVNLTTVNNVLPTTTNVIFGGNPAGVTGTYNSNVNLSLVGISQQVAGISTAGTGIYQVVGASATQSALIVTPSGADTFSGIIGGTATNNNNLSLTESGTGTLTLTGANTYTGGTTVSSGTLAGTTTSLQGNIFNSSALVFDQTLPTTPIASGTYAGVIAGLGSVTKNNAGTVILTGSSPYAGTTTINGGTLQIGNGTSGSLGGTTAVNVGGSTTLTVNNNGALNNTSTNVTLGSGTAGGTLQNALNGTATPDGLGNTVTANNVQQAGTLSLGTGTSDILDFANNTGTFDFTGADTSLSAGQALTIENFGAASNEAAGAAGAEVGNYQLLVDNGLNATQLGDISFLNSDSTQFGAIEQQITSGVNMGKFQILEGAVAAPEPAQTAALGLFGLGLGALILKARKRKSEAV